MLSRAHALKKGGGQQDAKHGASTCGEFAAKPNIQTSDIQIGARPRDATSTTEETRKGSIKLSAHNMRVAEIKNQPHDSGGGEEEQLVLVPRPANFDRLRVKQRRAMLEEFAHQERKKKEQHAKLQRQADFSAKNGYNFGLLPRRELRKNKVLEEAADEPCNENYERLRQLSPSGSVGSRALLQLFARHEIGTTAADENLEVQAPENPNHAEDHDHPLPPQPACASGPELLSAQLRLKTGSTTGLFLGTKSYPGYVWQAHGDVGCVAEDILGGSCGNEDVDQEQLPLGGVILDMENPKQAHTGSVNEERYLLLQPDDANQLLALLDIRFRQKSGASGSES
eukprot:g1571.t1